MARLTSSLSVRISDTLRFHAWYDAATSSTGSTGSGGNSASSGSAASPALTPFAVGRSSTDQVSQRSSRASPEASGQCQVSRTQPALTDPATSGSTASTVSARSPNATCVDVRRPSRPA